MKGICRLSVLIEPFESSPYHGGRVFGDLRESWQQPELPAWEVPKRHHERRPRAPDYWEPDETAEIAELTPASEAA